MSAGPLDGGYLLDTNVLSELMREAPAPEVLHWFAAQTPNRLYTCAINQAETLAGIAVLPAGKRRDALARAAQQIFVDEFAGRCLAFGSGSAEQFALVIAQRRRMGRPIEAVDAQVAAVALAAHLKLVTRNAKDFAGIDSLEVINPWQPH
jgi:predicted nucleic acid-binding protein